MALTHPAFEAYYPARFGAKAKKVMAEQNRDTRKQLKENLIRDVLKWADANAPAAKLEFEKSAAEVIAFLRTIEIQLTK
jgi:hypothetical protein